MRIHGRATGSAGRPAGAVELRLPGQKSSGTEHRAAAPDTGRNENGIERQRHVDASALAGPLAIWIRRRLSGERSGGPADCGFSATWR